AHAERANSLSRCGRHAEAFQDWERALALCDASGKDAIRVDRSAGLARQGDHAGATAEAANLAATQAASGPVLHRLASVYSLAGRAARQDSQLSAGDQDKLADQYATRAIEILSQAAATDYYQDAGNVATLKTDRDFEPLQSRADFQRLLEKL